jgi:hypothetical protein
MTSATVTAFEPVHACWQALIDEAIERFHHFPSVPHLAPITEGRSLVVWDNLSRCAGTDNRAASYLHAALVAQANRASGPFLLIVATKLLSFVDS